MKWLNKILGKKEKSIYDILKPHEEAFTHKPTEIKLDVMYNSQLDNKSFNKIPPSSQCGYTTIAMVLSQCLPKAQYDEFIAEVIEQFEKLFLTGGKFRTGSSMDSHVKIYEYYIQKYKLNKEVVFIPQDGSIDDILTALKCNSAVEFSWKPTKDGHFSTIVGYSELKKSFIIHDPFGKYDCRKKQYTREPGAYNVLSIDDITPIMNQSSKNGKGYRILYLKDKI